MPACRNSLGLPAAIAEHRAEIAEARGLAGAAGGEIVPRHRNGEVGPQAQFLAAGVGGQIEALADVLAGEVEERLGRLQDRRLGLDVAGLRKRQQQRVRPGGGPGGTLMAAVTVISTSKVRKAGSKGLCWRSP